VCGDEVPGEKEGNARCTSQAKGTLWDELRDRTLPDDPKSKEADRQHKSIDDERMRKDV
jgi:hypothetical protein